MSPGKYSGVGRQAAAPERQAGGTADVSEFQVIWHGSQYVRYPPAEGGEESRRGQAPP